jgi:putative aldouronate transport system permease protein
MNQVAVNIIFIILVCICLFPFLLLLMASITEQKVIAQDGYSLLPREFSLEAYTFLFKQSTAIVRSYGITVFITVIGTAVGLMITSWVAYPLSRADMPLRRVVSFFVFFTLLFNGGLVPTYLVYTEIFHMKNTILALIVPFLLTNGFFILLVRSFFSTSIPAPIIESALMDGASETRIFYQIVMPLSMPILATIGLMLTIAYWNDWFNGLIFITEPKLFSIQNLLNRMLSDIQFLQTANMGGNQAQALAKIPVDAVRMAMAVLGILPLLCVYPFFQKYFVKGLTIGAVKG